MGRFDYEKNIPRIGGPGGRKGNRASPKNQFENQCSNCGGNLPCRNAACRRSSGQDRHKAYKTAPTKKAKKKVAKPAKKGFLSCSIIIFLTLSLGGYGGFEVISWML